MAKFETAKTVNVGFYNKLDNIDTECCNSTYAFLKDLPVSNESTAYNYLHGSCIEFAAILSDVCGYSIECVRYGDGDDVDEGRLIHAYCTADMNGKKVYIDVRGITSSLELFFKEFSPEVIYCNTEKGVLWDYYDAPALIETWSSKTDLCDGDYEDFEDEEIKSFICKNLSYYDIKTVFQKEPLSCQISLAESKKIKQDDSAVVPSKVI